jgi:[acyl-carrier-protein] S-malonyltransferase
MKDFGIQSFTEVGPGKILQGLNKRIDRKIATQGVESLEQVEHFNV